jgi:hypothetical protein
MDVLMTMSDGSVMSMPSGMAMNSMSSMSGMSGTGTAMAGMNMTGAAGRSDGGKAWGVGMAMIGLGAGVGFLAGKL